MMNADDALPAKVLIVDDNEQNVELLQAYLEEIEGAESRVARDGLEALEAVAQDPPDLILLDIMMPNMSGFEVCKQLKENPTTRDIPIIIVTALNESSDYERGMEAAEAILNASGLHAAAPKVEESCRPTKMPRRVPPKHSRRFVRSRLPNRN